MPGSKKTYAMVLMTGLWAVALAGMPAVGAQAASADLLLKSLSYVAPHKPLLVETTGSLDAKDVKTGDRIGVGAKKFIDDMGQHAIGFLSNNSYTIEKKESEFRNLLRESFDMRTIGRFALGRYWNVATQDQQSEYQRLFEDMVVKVYSNRFNDYKGQEFDVSSFRRDGDKDTIVTSYIVPDAGSKIQVDWRVRYKSGTYKIVDVIIEGVSMSMTQRSDFSSVIQRGGGNIGVLINYLRDQ